MKKLLTLAIAALALAACQDKGKTVPAEEVLRQRDSLMAIISDKDNELNDFMASFTDVQDGLRQISEAEGRVTVANANLEVARNREVVRENMDFIRKSLEERREQIANLQARLKKSSLNVEKMQAAINNLQKQVEEQNAHIQQLEVQLAEKDARIAQQADTISQHAARINELSDQNRRKDETVAAQDKALNEAYFVFGTKAELKNQKILSSGEVLTQADFNKDYFTRIDIRVDKQIKLYSKRATIKTTHPAGSYTLTKDSKGEYVLNIVNPKEFWSTSRYLVVLVK